MPLEGDYEPSSSQWVRDQVEEYESSGGTRGTTMRGVPVVVITSVGATSRKLRKNHLSPSHRVPGCIPQYARPRRRRWHRKRRRRKTK